MPRGHLKLFFSMLQGRSFAPKHIMDVGANHGKWTRVALKYFPDAYYTLIEPQDHLRAHVADLLTRNSRDSLGGSRCQRHIRIFALYDVRS